MRDSRKSRRGMILTAIAAFALAVPAFAQVPPGGGGGAPAPGGGAPGAGQGGAGQGGGGQGGGSNVLSTLGSGAAGAQGGGGGTNAPSSTNFLSSFYSYPYLRSLPATDTGAANRTQRVESEVSQTRAAFGGATLAATTGTTGSRTTGRGTATVRGGGTGGTTGQGGGFNAGVAGSNLSRMPRYVAALRFPATTISSDNVLADVRDVIERAATVPSKARITIAMQGRNVELRGEVGSDDERRHVEALVRLTPGVGTITNELVVK